MNICNIYDDPRMQRTFEENVKSFTELVTAAVAAGAANRALKLILGFA